MNIEAQEAYLAREKEIIRKALDDDEWEIYQRASAILDDFSRAMRGKMANRLAPKLTRTQRAVMTKAAKASLDSLGEEAKRALCGLDLHGKGA